MRSEKDDRQQRGLARLRLILKTKIFDTGLIIFFIFIASFLTTGCSELTDFTQQKQERIDGTDWYYFETDKAAFISKFTGGQYEDSIIKMDLEQESVLIRIGKIDFEYYVGIGISLIHEFDKTGEGGTITSTLQRQKLILARPLIKLMRQLTIYSLNMEKKHRFSVHAKVFSETIDFGLTSQYDVSKMISTMKNSDVIQITLSVDNNDVFIRSEASMKNLDLALEKLNSYR